MAHSYKNIVITPNIGANSDPTVQFSGGNTTVNTDITLRVYPDSNGTLSFEGSAGQLFSVTNDLTGSLFAVNDVSGIPLIEVNVTSQQITFGEFYGNVGIGKAASTSSTYKLDVNGTINASNVLINGNAITGSVTSLTPANNYSNTLYSSALAAGNSAANSANAYTVTVGAAANVTHWIYANGVANSANAYAVTVGAASNNWANTLGTNTALAYSWTNTHTFSSNVFYRNTSNIVWITNSASTTSNVTLRNYPDSNGTLSFEGSAGQLFSITNDLTGSLFSVNDVSGIPLIEVNVTSQQITFGEFYGNVGIGKAAATSSIYKLDVNGTVNASNYLINTFPVAALSYANGVANSANAYAVTVGAAGNTAAYAFANGVANSANSGKVTSVTGTAGQIFSSGGTTPALNLITTAVTSSTYGGATQIPVFTVDTFGRLTYAANVAVSASGMDYPYANQIGAASNTWANSLNAKVFTSATSPTGNVNGTLWWNTNVARLFVYYNDGDSSQWVEANPVITGSISDASNSANIYAMTYANTVANSANIYAMVYANGVANSANAYAVTGDAASNTWANTKLANTSGVWTAGNLNVTGFANASSFVYDSKGDVRDNPLNTRSALYALTISDAGKLISTTANVFVPNAVFAAGHTIIIFNSSSTTRNIIANSGVTLRLSGGSNSASKLLTQNGVMTILCVGANNFVVYGTGVS